MSNPVKAVEQTLSGGHAHKGGNMLFIILGLAIVLCGVYALNIVFQWVYFDIGIAQETLLMITSIGSIIGGILLVFKGF